MQKDTTPNDFLKPELSKSKTYVEFDETPEVIAAITAEEKDRWREVYSFAHMTNREGREWTETDVKHQCERFYLAMDKVRAVFQRVYAENKDEYGIVKRPEIYKVEIFLNKNWEFVKNEVTQRAEYRLRRAGEDFTNLNVDTIYRKLQHVNFKFPMEKLKSLLKSDFMKIYNPFKDYFENLEQWDYETDHIGHLANFVQTTEQEFHVNQFRKMLVRCIGCALYGYENRFVYVFVGEKQETGKSTFIRFLNPFGNKYYTEAPIRDNKDTYFSFAENFIQNLEELASLSNIEVNHMKSVISMKVIKERKAYEVNAEEQLRRVNFFGSTNKDEFLTDSENTRWICVNVTSIDWNYINEVDISKVWAQAFALYHDKDFNQQLTKEEMALRDSTNKNFEITDIEKDLIKQCFEVADKSTGVFYSNPDIITALTNKYQGKPLNARFIGKSMTQLGFIKDSQYVNGHKTRGYYVNPIEGATFKEYVPKAGEVKEGEQKEINFKF